MFLCAAAMIPSNFVSVWQIQLEAPQYPEGMKMEIWSHKIAGDIGKINSLNHYIGMEQIKEENFPEFKIMPWMIWAFVAPSSTSKFSSCAKVLEGRTLN